MKIRKTKKNHLSVIVFIGDKVNDSDCVFFRSISLDLVLAYFDQKFLKKMRA